MTREVATNRAGVAGGRLWVPRDLGALTAEIDAQGRDGAASLDVVPHVGGDSELRAGDALVLAPLPWNRDSAGGPRRAGERARDLRAAGLTRLVLVSSAQCYGASHHLPGLIDEDYKPGRRGRDVPAEHWRALEAEVRAGFGEEGLVVLRPAAWDARGDPVLRRLRARFGASSMGYDPCLQVVDPRDLARAVIRAAVSGVSGVFNVAPAGTAPLSAVRAALGARRIPVPHSLLRLARNWPARRGWCDDASVLEYQRHSTTISGRSARETLGFEAESDTLAALGAGSAAHDSFGLDTDYILRRKRGLLRFLHRYYWRVEVEGLQHVPRGSGAVLTAIHRGFMPFDGVMLVHLLTSRLGRAPRFLIHPSLVKFPFLAPFMQKLGGIVASTRNADRVLRSGEVLGFFPEGIRGAFTPFKDAYKLGRFGRDEFVRTALKNRVPIVPCVTVGSAEIFPIIGRLDWGWFKRWTEWPYLPITPTFPLLPVPLPSKWHTSFLPPLHVEEQYPPEAADDRKIVRMISAQVRAIIEAEIADMLSRRKHVFYGSLASAEVTECPSS